MFVELGGEIHPAVAPDANYCGLDVYPLVPSFIEWLFSFEFFTLAHIEASLLLNSIYFIYTDIASNWSILFFCQFYFSVIN